MEAKTTVFIIRPDPQVLLGKISADKLVHFSRYASQKLFKRGDRDARLNASSLTISPDLVDGKQAEAGIKQVLGWIDANNIKNPTILDPDTLGLTTFPELVYLYSACNILHIDHVLRGEIVRDEIIKYIRCALLRFDEFAMILEVLPWDISLNFVAKNNVMFKNISEGVPEMAQIEAYAKECGFWDDMVRIEQQIRGGMKAKAAQDKAREAAAAKGTASKGKGGEK